MKKIIIIALLIASFFTGRSQSISFSGSFSNHKLQFAWSTDLNELTDRFEVEKSYDGINFTTAALVFSSEKKGPEDYKFYENVSLNRTVFYRIKIFNYDKTVKFSKVLLFPVSIDEK